MQFPIKTFQWECEHANESCSVVRAFVLLDVCSGFYGRRFYSGRATRRTRWERTHRTCASLNPPARVRPQIDHTWKSRQVLILRGNSITEVLFVRNAAKPLSLSRGLLPSVSLNAGGRLSELSLPHGLVAGGVGHVQFYTVFFSCVRY
jgi:hypothetical protein